MLAPYIFFIDGLTSRNMAYQQFDRDTNIDPKVPVLRGEMLKDFKKYKTAVKATVLSIEDGDKKRVGPKLYRNLFGLGNSISILIEQRDPAQLAKDDGADIFIKYLEDNRFGISALKEIPRVYDVDALPADRRGPDDRLLHGH